MKMAERLRRDLARLGEGLRPSAIAVGVIGTLALVAIAVTRPSGESRVIFHRDGPIDFKNASILGDPRRSILKAEESAFGRQQRGLLEVQKDLKSELERLREEVRALKGGTPAAAASPAPTASGSLDAPATADLATGPAPTPTLAPPSEQYTGTEISGIAKDELATTRAAPTRPSLGLGNLPRQSGSARPGKSMISFPVKSTGKAFLREPGVTLPSGSYVKAKLLTGVEAPEGKTYPALMQLDFAHIIPNNRRLDLSGCFMIAKAQGDLSTERVQMQASKLSCVSKRGGFFEREINGFVADDVDNSFAVIGRVNTKQDRVAATAFLASIVSGIGKAIQQAQTTQQTTPLGGGQSVLTGDQGKFIAAGGASEAATMVTQWYLKQAQNLLPTINVGSGQDVWVIMQDQVDLPREYFNHNGGSINASVYSYLTRLVD
jgi:conjugal transfer pilus assembly protein TraB